MNLFYSYTIGFDIDMNAISIAVENARRCEVDIDYVNIDVNTLADDHFPSMFWSHKLLLLWSCSRKELRWYCNHEPSIWNKEQRHWYSLFESSLESRQSCRLFFTQVLYSWCMWPQWSIIHSTWSRKSTNGDTTWLSLHNWDLIFPLCIPSIQSNPLILRWIYYTLRRMFPSPSSCSN